MSPTLLDAGDATRNLDRFQPGQGLKVTILASA